MFQGHIFIADERWNEAIPGATQACSICITGTIQEGTRKATRTTDIGTLSVDEPEEWWNSFVIVPKPNSTVFLCLDPMRLNQALTRPVHRGSTINDILPKLTNTYYMTLIDSSGGYHNLKHDKKSSYLTTFACQFGMYRFTTLPSAVVSAGDMFQQIIKRLTKCFWYCWWYFNCMARCK